LANDNKPDVTPERLIKKQSSGYNRVGIHPAKGRCAVGAYMVNRYPAAGGQVPKVPLTVMQFAR